MHARTSSSRLNADPHAAAAVRALVDCRWNPDGADPESGFDCLTLVAYARGLLGLPFVMPAHHRGGRSIGDPAAFAAQYERLEAPELGAVVELDGRPRHLGLMLNRAEFIHCNELGVWISRLGRVRRRVLGYYGAPLAGGDA